MKMEVGAPFTKSSKARGLSRLWQILVPRRCSNSRWSAKGTTSAATHKTQPHQTLILPAEQSKDDVNLGIRKLVATEQLNYSKPESAESNVTEDDSELNSVSITKFTDPQILGPPMTLLNQNTKSIYEFPLSTSPEERKRPATSPLLPAISFFGDSKKECRDNKDSERCRSTSLTPLDSPPTQIPPSQEVATEPKEGC